MSKNRGLGSLFEEIRGDWPIVLLILATLIAGFIIYPSLPDRVPSHWNIHGEVDGYSSGFWGAFGIPLLAAGIYLMMVVLPGLDPRKENYVRFKGAYRAIKLVLVLFLTMLYVIIVMSALGYSIPVSRFVTSAVGLLFIVLGNFMGQLRHNYFVGIKTPWTLASEEVWRKTHRLSSKVWVIAGVAMALAGLLAGGDKAALIIGASIAVTLIIPVGYSYLAFRQLNEG